MKLPRFTVRDLLWLVLACALGIGWWTHQRSLKVARETDRARFDNILDELQLSARRQGYEISWDPEYGVGLHPISTPNKNEAP